MTRFFLLTLFLVFSFTTNTAKAACSNPAGIEGNQVYNTTHKTMQFCDGTNWYSMKGGAVGGSDDLGNHNATQDLDLGSNNIINLNDPASAQDAATKAYVDANGGITTETDPKIGTLTEGKWCTVSGGKVVCTSDAPGGGIVTSQTTMSCSHGSGTCTTPACPVGYIRSGCDASHQNGRASPSGTNKCQCVGMSSLGTCYLYCVQ